MRILVAREKHETRYLAADTLEQWANSCLQLLRERMEWGYIYDPRKESPSFYSLKDSPFFRDNEPLSDDEINKLPTKELINAALAVKAAYKKIMKRHQQATDEYLEILAVVESNDTSMVTWGRPGRERTQPKAWDILEGRNDHEYEGVSMETVEEYDKDGNKV